jgi:NAD(P)H-dependent flavin oxidoreductase YrpB (nitropropane dioxygenase family)
METAFTRLLGIKHPIVQAPIGGMAIPRLAAAVSNAGGLGMIALTWSSPDEIQEAIAETRSLTDQPFGVNLILDWPQVERVERVLAEGIRFISFFWGDPTEHLAAIHRAGAVAALTVGSADEARRGVAAGVDVVVAQGWEAGGHVRGQVATLPLVPAVVDAVSPTPVVAAGGITDGRGLAAALALGASAAWLGTRFVMSDETPALPEYRERLARATETETVYSSVFDGGWEDAPHRTLRSSTTDAWEAAGRPRSGGRPGEGDVVGRWDDGEEIHRYDSTSPREGFSGDVEALPMWSGQGVALIHDVRPAGEIVRSIAAEAEETLRRLATAGGLKDSARLP